jgi:hypothetical protein
MMRDKSFSSTGDEAGLGEDSVVVGVPGLIIGAVAVFVCPGTVKGVLAGLGGSEGGSA